MRGTHRATGGRTTPRFTEEGIARDRALPRPLEEIAGAHGSGPAQIALAWVLSRGEQFVPMRRAHLDETVVARDIILTPEELDRLDAAFPPGAAAGDRSTPEVARWAGR